MSTKLVDDPPLESSSWSLVVIDSRTSKRRPGRRNSVTVRMGCSLGFAWLPFKATMFRDLNWVTCASSVKDCQLQYCQLSEGHTLQSNAELRVCIRSKHQTMCNCLRATLTKAKANYCVGAEAVSSHARRACFVEVRAASSKKAFGTIYTRRSSGRYDIPS